MSAAEVKAVKAAVTEYVGMCVTSLTIGSVAAHVRIRTGLDFSGPVIAKYVAAHGFERKQSGKDVPRYVKREA